MRAVTKYSDFSPMKRAFVENCKLNALMIIDLLYGDAEKGRAIALKKSSCMSVQDYKEFMSGFNYTVNR